MRGSIRTRYKGSWNIIIDLGYQHDTGGGCHSSNAPSGLVALSKEHRRWGNLLITYSKKDLAKVSGRE
jgi:hypothetical protein